MEPTEFFPLTKEDFRCRQSSHRDHAANDETLVPVEFEGILGVTLTMRPVIQQIMEAAAEDIPVLLSGETGTGKDLVAVAIHKRSKRKRGPFLPVNMGGIAAELVSSDCSAMPKAPIQEPVKLARDCSSRPKAGPYFLTRLQLWTREPR
jgi:two-component system, NtrC family, response regulator AtoC